MTEATINQDSLAAPRESGKKTVPVGRKPSAAHFSFLAKILSLAVFTTALAFAWTAWNLVRVTSMSQGISLGVAAGLLTVCLGTWIVAARSMLACRHAAECETDLIALEEKLRKERDLLRTIVNQLPDHIYAKDCEGRFVFNNLAHARSLGVSAPQALIGKGDLDFFQREQALQFLADEKKIIDTEQALIDQEQFNKMREQGGQRRWYSASKVLWRDPQGRILGTVGITRDIHARKVAEEKLRQFTQQLERSNRELQDFAYVASHDLQEPLRKIVVFGERLKERSGTALGTEGCDYLDRMQKAASRMQTLINDLLSFSRVTSKAKPFTSVNLAEVAREVVSDLEARIEQVQGRVELGELPVIEAEPLQMRQLFQNLIGNALKFRKPTESPVVKVSVSPIVPQEGGTPTHFRLTVSDNGIGFDEKYLDRIFNVFQRLHTRAEYEGTGMGLAIARKIAFHHGGEITAESKAGTGATFIVTLPATHPKETANA